MTHRLARLAAADDHLSSGGFFARLVEPQPAELYGCDCCGIDVLRDQIAVVTTYGIETAACAKCRGVERE